MPPPPRAPPSVLNLDARPWPAAADASQASAEEAEERADFAREGELMRLRIEGGAGALQEQVVIADTSAAAADGTDVQAVADPSEGTTIFIDVSDDAAPIPLVVRASDEPLTLSQEFVQAHGLPDSYITRIADFIVLMTRR